MASNALFEFVAFYLSGLISKKKNHQGDMFSMFLYCVYNNDSLEDIKTFWKKYPMCS